MPPSTDELSEEFSGMVITSLIDLFSGYDQLPLEKSSRDLTAFHTPIGLLRQTRLPQGWTNAVPEFMRVMSLVLKDEIPEDAAVYIDDIPIKGQKGDQVNFDMVLPGIRGYVLDHLQRLDRVLYSLELAGLTVAPGKSQFAVPAIKVVGYICDIEGRHPATAKVIKILEWPVPSDLREARSFIGIVVYYRIWIPGFAVIARPIYILFRKGEKFYWGNSQQEAMDKLKIAITSAPALISIDYSENGGDIIVSTDASGEGWGAVLMQALKENAKRRHPVRFESGIWIGTQLEYDAGKKECLAVLRALKKFRSYLYGIRFILETDAKTLVAQLNRSATDLPGSLVVRWIAWIRLFDFTVKHVPGTKNSAADALSRRPATESDRSEAENEDIDAFLDNQLTSVYHVSAGEDERSAHYLDENEFWTEESLKIAEYLLTLSRPEGMSSSEFYRFKKKAMKFFVQDDFLFRRASKNLPAKRVIDDKKKRKDILKALHEESGHRDREATYRKIADRYWWEGMWKDVRDWVKTCDPCQRSQGSRFFESLQPIHEEMPFWRVVLDCVKLMPPSNGMNYAAIARDALSGYPEVKTFAQPTSEGIAKFLYEDIICRWNCFTILTSDGGPENLGVVEILTKRYKIRHIKISAYNPRANGTAEVGHKPFIRALRKLTKGTGRRWKDHLPALVWADRNTVKASTGMTPIQVLCGYDPILPIELEIPTWRTLPWTKIRSTEDLLLMRARQIERRDKDTEEARFHIQRLRERNKELFDEKLQLRSSPLDEGKLVLVHDSRLDPSRSAKLQFRWFGPFRIRTAHENGSYLLEELDRTCFRKAIHGNRLKVYFSRAEDEIDDEEMERILTAGDELTEESENRDDRDLIPPGEDFAVVIPHHS
jgi:hypothetical protein